MSQQLYDVIIIGAGPAGIFAALELASSGIKRVLIIEKGQEPSKRKCPREEVCLGCDPCKEIEGVGGAGGFSDGKLCNGPVGIDKNILGEDYPTLVRYVNDAFIRALGSVYDIALFSQTVSFQTGRLSITITPVVRLGSLEIRRVFAKIFDSLPISKETGVEATDVSFDGDYFSVETRGGGIVKSQRLIVATGKCDFVLRERVVKNFSLKTFPNTPQIGVRLETFSKNTEKLLEMGPNPKIKREFEYGHVKTHCFNHGGEVMAYKCGQFVLVGGRLYSIRHLTDFSDLNIVYKVRSREKASLVMQSLREIKERVGLKTLSQDLISFLSKQRPSSSISSRLAGSIIVNFENFYPSFVVESIREFIEDLIENGFLSLSEEAFIYGPAVEWLLSKIEVDKSGETSVPGLFIIGDVSGKTQGIIAASVMGVRAARKIVETL